MVDLGQTGGRDSACLFLHHAIKKPTVRKIGFIIKKNSFYFSIAKSRATSVQLITLKKASI